MLIRREMLLPKESSKETPSYRLTAFLCACCMRIRKTHRAEKSVRLLTKPGKVKGKFVFVFRVVNQMKAKKAPEHLWPPGILTIVQPTLVCRCLWACLYTNNVCVYGIWIRGSSLSLQEFFIRSCHMCLCHSRLCRRPQFSSTRDTLGWPCTVPPMRDCHLIISTTVLRTSCLSVSV